MIDGYATHLKLLVRYALTAPIGSTLLEMGCGGYSSPVLSEIAKAKGLKYVIHYSDKIWAEKVKPMVEAEWVHVDWDNYTPQEAFLTLLDSEQLVVKRYETLKKILPLNNVVIIHDYSTYAKWNCDLSGFNILDACDLGPGTCAIKGKEEKAVCKPSSAPEISKPATTWRTGWKSAIVCAYTPGGDFDGCWKEYVSRLYKSVVPNVGRSLEWDFVCLSKKDPQIEGVIWKKLAANLEGWHVKFEMFREDLWEGYDNVLFLDLDTVVVGRLDDMLSIKQRFSLLADLYHPTKPASGVVLFEPKGFNFLFEKACLMNPVRRITDIYLIVQWLKQAGIEYGTLQDFYKIVSYKADVRDKQEIDHDTQIVCFHGKPRPQEVLWKIPAKERQPESKDDVPLIYSGKTIYIIGGGPSLKGVDLDAHLMDKVVIAVNDAYSFKCADLLFFGDAIWYRHHSKDITIPAYTTSTARGKNVANIRRAGTGVSSDPRAIAFNNNSGFGAINLALLLGAKKIVLLGFDMQMVDGEANWHNNIRRTTDNTYKGFLRFSQNMALGIKTSFPEVEVINACPSSKLEPFRKMDLQRALRGEFDGK